MNDRGAACSLIPSATSEAAVLFRLAKVPLCLMVGGSAGFGYLLCEPAFTLVFFLVTVGIFLLACSAATLNSIQERREDSLHRRTCTRPMVRGDITLPAAFAFAAVSGLTGCCMLFFTGNTLLPLLLGLGALLLYNLVYTPMKKVSEFAMIPGGIAGALPPFIGWTAAGGPTGSLLIWSVMALFFLWQPPHFCLILLEYEDEYRDNSNFTNLITRFTVPRVKNIVTTWLLSFLTVVLSFTLFPGFLSPAARAVLAIGAPAFMLVFILHLHLAVSPRYKLLFVSLNSFLLCVMILLALSSFMAAV